MKKNIKIGCSILLFIGVIITCLYLRFTEGERYVKRCYYGDKDKFEYMKKYFSQMYEPGLNYIIYDVEDFRHSVVTKKYDNNKYSEKHEDEVACVYLAELKEKYKDDSDYGCFYAVFVNYDDSGHMKMSIPVRLKKISGKSAEERNTIYHYLIYIDDAYKNNDRTARLLYGNWYWETDVDYIG